MNYLKSRYAVIRHKKIVCKNCGLTVEVNTKTIKYCLRCITNLKSNEYIKSSINSIAFYEVKGKENSKFYNLQAELNISSSIEGYSLGDLKDNPKKPLPKVEEPVDDDYYSKDLDPLSEETQIVNNIKRRLNK